jgi:di/tripeptidase
VPGGLEPAVIKRFLRPGVPVGALGATITNPHSTEESLVVSTVPEAMRFLRHLLIEVATCDRFLAPQSPSIPE